MMIRPGGFIHESISISMAALRVAKLKKTPSDEAVMAPGPESAVAVWPWRGSVPDDSGAELAFSLTHESKLFSMAARKMAPTN
jgi:hypothetical protein